MGILSLIETVKQQPLTQPKKRGRKSKIQNITEDIIINPSYRPAGWKESSLSFAETIEIFESLKKKKKDLNEQELVIAHNYEILKSCYRTPKHTLNLAKEFIGEFNFDPFYNPYGFTNSGQENFKTLSGYSSEDDGFKLHNWKRVTTDLDQVIGWGNPPFNRLEDAATVTNAFIDDDTKNSRFAFLTTFDFTNYLSDCFRSADYYIMLGRVAFLGMPGVNTSTPRGSVGMVIYNSRLDIDNSRFVEFEGNSYYTVDLRKERTTLHLKQLSLIESASKKDLEELVKSKQTGEIVATGMNGNNFEIARKK